MHCSTIITFSQQIGISQSVTALICPIQAIMSSCWLMLAIQCTAGHLSPDLLLVVELMIGRWSFTGKRVSQPQNI